jgi:hypothetical protein
MSKISGRNVLRLRIQQRQSLGGINLYIQGTVRRPVGLEWKQGESSKSEIIGKWRISHYRLEAD